MNTRLTGVVVFFATNLGQDDFPLQSEFMREWPVLGSPPVLSCWTLPAKNGAANGTRTRDPKIHNFVPHYIPITYCV